MSLISVTLPPGATFVSSITLPPPTIKIIDNTCGLSPLHGPNIVYDPVPGSEACKKKRCEEENQKPPCLVLDFKTGDPNIPQPQYCQKQNCNEV